MQHNNGTNMSYYVAHFTHHNEIKRKVDVSDKLEQLQIENLNLKSAHSSLEDQVKLIAIKLKR